jgi:hypothetical protein
LKADEDKFLHLLYATETIHLVSGEVIVPTHCTLLFFFSKYISMLDVLFPRENMNIFV